MSMVSDFKKRVLAGELLGRESALALCNAPLEELSSAADEIRRYFCADTFDICTIVNGKCGRCSEDCKFCAQSAHYHTDIGEYPLLDTQELLRQAQYNAERGVLRYSIVTSGRRLSDAEVDQVCASIGHAATVANHKVYNGFYSDDPTHALMHGPTFMGNALACSVALKSIELFEQEGYLEKIKKIEAITRREMEHFTDPRIKEVRIMGGCICIEVYDARTLNGFSAFAYDRGVFSRPFLNYMYAMVPYIIQESELVRVLSVMKEWFASTKQ